MAPMRSATRRRRSSPSSPSSTAGGVRRDREQPAAHLESGGILKAEAVLRQAQMLAEEGLAPSGPPGRRAGGARDRRGALDADPGQGNGRSLDYFLMLAWKRKCESRTPAR